MPRRHYIVAIGVGAAAGRCSECGGVLRTADLLSCEFGARRIGLAICRGCAAKLAVELMDELAPDVPCGRVRFYLIDLAMDVANRGAA